MRIVRWIAASLSLFSAACGSAGPSHGPPANVAKSTTDGQNVAAGTSVTPAPAVKVTDAEGRAVPGASVMFAVTAGGGTATGTSVSTDGGGIATVGGWTVGTVAGSNTLSATVASLAPVVFSVNGIPGPAATVEKTAGDGTESHFGTEVDPRPTVRVSDTHGNRVSGTSVTFALGSGGGSLTGATQTTDASGLATVGSWTLGASASANTLTATAASLPAVTFTATGVDMCARVTSHSIGSVSSGTLKKGDCLLSTGFNADKFNISSGSQVAIRVDQKSTQLDSRLLLFSTATSRLQQSNSANADATMTIIAGAGSFEMGASATTTATTGSYTFESTQVSESVTSCLTPVLVNQPSTQQSIQTSDCDDVTNSGTFDFDDFIFFAQAGRRYTIAMTTSAFNPYLEIQTLTGGPVASSFSTGSGTRTADIAVTRTNEHMLIYASTVSTGQTGNYTLTITSVATSVVADASPAVPETVVIGAGRPRGSNAARPRSRPTVERPR